MQIAVALGNGDGTFKAPNKFNHDIQYELEGLAVGDFNADGKPDVAISGYLGSEDSGTIFGNGDGTYREHRENGRWTRRLHRQQRCARGNLCDHRVWNERINRRKCGLQPEGQLMGSSARRVIDADDYCGAALAARC
jgi:hypothetical protein